MGADYLRGPRTAPLLPTTARQQPTNPSIPFPGEARNHTHYNQPGSPMVKKARDLERIHRDPYAEKRHDAYRQSGQGEGERERERERMHDEERRARRDQREKERLAQIEAHAAAEAEKEKERKREKEKEKEKAKEKDPDPKRKEHTRPPTVIVDTAKGAQYRRIGFLGEGGFARVYEVVDDVEDHRAVKVVNKANIKTKRNKTKLWAEIKLHQMLKHPNIVRFDECFEDIDNVYMVLELCDHGSLMDLLRRRKRYTEPEARFYLVQLIGACQYMQDTNVIHRDLKLGNIFLDGNMNVKVGDFGLAALIENPGDRKKTICGTPNYIAPEVLFDTANGHSFEVDVWSLGVILYTLLIGKPPFQTKEVKAIYRRIRENRYDFPEDKEISASAQNLVMSILNTDPQERPTLDQILKHQWFLDGPFPPFIPITSNDSAPDFSGYTVAQSRRNFENVLRKATGIESTTPSHPPQAQALGPSILAQERDFKAAVEPGSPISALLNSARQPLVQAPAGIKNGSLLRKLTEAGAQSTLSPVRRGTAPRIPSSVAGPGPSSRPPAMDNVVEEEDEGVDAGSPKRYTPAVRSRELEQQKARIVSEMAAMRLNGPEKGAEREVEPRKALCEAVVPRVGTQSAFPAIKLATKGNDYDRLEHNLTEAINAYKTHGGCRLPDGSIRHHPTVFVVSWLDYCAKYGMGFAMSDGTVSVHFNDTSSLALAPGKKHAEFVDDRARRSAFALSSPPDGLSSKIFLLHKFEGYMLSRLCGQYDYTFQDERRTSDLVYIEKYLRTKNVILFQLSNGILQFNFYDHTKIILSDDGLAVTIIDKHYVKHDYTLDSLFRAPSAEKERERHRHEKFLVKVEFARSLLARMRAHGGMDATMARVQEKERASKEAHRERDDRAERAERAERPPRDREPREARQPIRG